MIKNKLKILKQYVKTLKSSDSYIPNLGLCGDSEIKKGAVNIDIAISYFTIIYNFLIIETKFPQLVKMSGKELNIYLDIESVDGVDDVLVKFLELYDPTHKVRFAVETFDSIEEVREFIKLNDNLYNEFLK